MKTLRVVSFLVIAAAWLTVAPSVQSAETAEGKFHLVYLVSTDKVEVGAKAYVEPLFLTNGNSIEFVYRFCRAVLGVRGWSTHVTSAQLGGDDAAVVQQFCENKTQKLDGDKLFVINHYGSSVRLSTVTFETNLSDARFVIPPLLPKQGVTTISAVTGVSPKPSHQVGSDVALAPSFFWMASNRKILYSVVPLQARTQERASGLLFDSALAYSRNVQGTVYTWRFVDGPTLEEGEVRFDGPFPRAKHLAKSGVEVVAPIIVDVNQDGVNDIIFGMRDEGTEKSGDGTTRWAGTGIIIGGGAKAMFGTTTKSARVGFPYGVLRIQNCTYAVVSMGEQSTPYDLIPLPAASASCAYGRAYKFPEDVDNQYSPF